MTDCVSSERLSRLRHKLLGWYDRHRRDLPWRDTPDPYRVWISEVMLQQTQVTTVLPYYERFLRRFPSLADLAAAPLDDVLKAWEGLGYYARARHLHAAARQVMADLGGQLPTSYAALRRLPGFGDYTAGAVASIAFGERVPALDGNVKRVLTRLFAITDDISRGATVRRLRAVAAELVPPERPGDFNQALMELGATLCTPTSPRCRLCPLHTECQGLAQGIHESLPVKAPRHKRPHYDVTAAVIHGDNGQLLIAQRKPEAMLGGLWEFPGGKCQPGEALPDCLRREIREELGLEIEVGRHLTTIEHGYTHFRISLHVFECHHLAGEPRALDRAAWRWVQVNQLEDYAFPATDQKIIQLLKSG
ncbi:MAG: A/G-specific adenine glycosylase [Anaerolineae bacterium]